MLQRSKTPKSDILGISASLLCVLHCLSLPVLASAGNAYMYSGFGQRHGLDYLFILFGFAAVFFSSRKSSNFPIKLGLWLVISIFSLSILLHDSWPGMIYVSTVASLGLIVLHYFHWIRNRAALVCLAIVSGMLFTACGPRQNENEKLQNEVIAIHDEVMPLMGQLKSVQESLLERARELAQADSTTHTETIAALKETAGDLEEAYNSMFVWMRQFEMDHEGQNEDEVKQYLLEQKVKIEEVNAGIKRALERARTLNE